MIIETSRLLLQPHKLDVLEGYTRLWSAQTPEITGVPRFPPLGAEESWARLLRFIGHWEVFGFGPFVVTDTATSAIVGEVGFAYFHRGHGPAFDAAPEAMWKTDHRVQGRGLASEAMQAAIGWFDAHRLATRTVCMIDPGHGASLRIAGRCGFQPFADAIYRGHPVQLLQRSAA